MSFWRSFMITFWYTTFIKKVYKVLAL
jgi:hypothetical protein